MTCVTMLPLCGLQESWAAPALSWQGQAKQKTMLTHVPGVTALLFNRTRTHLRVIVLNVQ